jgi:formyltetrahydrofolate deformylase
MKTAVLKINCPDRKGIVAEVCQIIAECSGNIIDAQQHREELNSHFFMYVRFDVADKNCDKCELELKLKEKSDELGFTWEISYSDQKKRMAIMVSKYDHCLYDLLLKHKYGELDTNVALVMSNHPDLKSVADHFGIPFYHIPRTKENREEADREAVKIFQEQKVSFVVMARYMQILTPILLNAYPNKVINVHHGFLPAFKGAKPYHQAYAKGVKLIGATSHYANEELDMGPIIEQETERVTHSFSAEDMVTTGRDIENRVLATAVKAHAEDRIIIFEGRTIIFA